MNLKEFDKLTARDFENGAVRDAIRLAVKQHDDLLAALEALIADIDGCETEEDFIIMANGFAVEQARAALAGARGGG